MNCPKCKSSEFNKDGIVRTLQRYKCKKCNYRYTVEKKSDVKPIETKRFALEMYLEGLGFRSIGRLLKISHVTVYQWINEWADKVELPKCSEPVEIVELDEMHTYIMSKKTTVGFGLLLIDLEKGMSILSVGTDQQKHLKYSGKKSKN
jgi:transposase-like protein